MSNLSVSSVTYPFNPNRDQPTAIAPMETQLVTPVNGVNYATFIPRSAPFFGAGLKLYNNATGAGLTRNVDYVLGYYYDRLSVDTYRELYGCITLLNTTTPVEVKLDPYAVLGGDFTLNDVQYASTVANLLNNPRTVDWSQVADTPASYPPVQHSHATNQTLNYQDYVDALTAMQTSVSALLQGFLTTINTHIDTHGNAHQASKTDFELGNVANYAPAQVADIPSNNSELYVTLDIAKSVYYSLFSIMNSVALGSSELPDIQSSAQTVNTLKIFDEASLLTSDEQANLTLWKVYYANLLIKANTGTTTVYTPPAANTALARLLGA